MNRKNKIILTLISTISCASMVCVMALESQNRVTSNLATDTLYTLKFSSNENAPDPKFMYYGITYGVESETGNKIYVYFFRAKEATGFLANLTENGVFKVGSPSKDQKIRGIKKISLTYSNKPTTINFGVYIGYNGDSSNGCDGGGYRVLGKAGTTTEVFETSGYCDEFKIYNRASGDFIIYSVTITYSCEINAL